MSSVPDPSDEKLERAARLDAIAEDYELPKLYTSREILNTEWPEPAWIVRDLIPAGLTLLTGGPKLGKSFMVLDLAVSIAEGASFLGKYSTDRGTVVYVAAEDLPSRLRRRLEALRASGSDNLFVGLNPPVGVVSMLGAVVREHPDTKLVIVDTFQRVRERQPPTRETLYQIDYRAASDIKQIADELGISFVLVHHTNKRSESGDRYDSISGSNGLAAAVDTNMILTRTRGQRDAELSVDGRDTEEQKIALEFNPDLGSWTALGTADEIQSTKERQEIYDVLKGSGKPLQPKEVASILSKNVNTTSNLMRKMYSSGALDKLGHGSYAVAGVANVANETRSSMEPATVATLATAPEEKNPQNELDIF